MSLNLTRNNNYKVPPNFLDEVFTHDLKLKTPYHNIFEFFNSYDIEQFKKLNDNIKLSFLNQGITYQVYNDNNEAKEHIFPFDILPRVITKNEWDTIERGVLQRTKALNLFLEDVYNTGHIFKDKIIPKDMIISSAHYCKPMIGFKPKGGVYCHISGTDLIKHTDNEFYVLEDNLRSPSGVSYVISNRKALKKSLGFLLKKNKIKSVSEYPTELLHTLRSVAKETNNEITCVLLTPGMFNSAYFEHAFLAFQMGIELVEGQDLFVQRNVVYMKTTNGPKKVDVIYRRIDDEFLDPRVFRKDSLLGIPGVMKAYLSGQVSIVNAPGTGIADDKAIYKYVPDIIKYYLNEEPILSNVETYICENPSHLKYVLENVEKLVVKPVDLSGGYGVKIGSKLSKQEIEETREEIKANPRNFVAQPIMSLSLHTTYIENDDTFAPRHIDLRTFCLMGDKTNYVLKGGLTRVALKEGNLIVNSSQGGGSKDTWVIEN